METLDPMDSGLANVLVYEQMYQQYLEDPTKVEPSWKEIFDNLEQLPPAEQQDQPPPLPKVPGEKNESVLYKETPTASSAADPRIFDLVEGYRIYGHLMAQIDPIGTVQTEIPEQLQIEYYGFNKKELPKEFPTCGILPQKKAPLLSILNALKTTYCGKIGVQYLALQNSEMEHWIQNRIEPTLFKVELSIEQKQIVLGFLNKAELFEAFLHMKYVGQKRFSLEGAETLIPMLAIALDTGAKQGAEEFVIGMAHRGRLNVLSNLMNKPYSDIFNEFKDEYIPDSYQTSGDVKYHKGFTSAHVTIGGQNIQVSLPPNPSHLECIDAVVEGNVKARQILLNDVAQEKVVPILIHGDAAIAGQGIVYETMQMYKLGGYCTGGTIHFVINNQIGFTTSPKDSRSTRYCTDIGLAFSAPIFHVNAEDPESCIFATILAMEIRQKFHCDVFIDLVCYRKYGHNEGDEPFFTQPLEYKIIKKKKSIRRLYRDYLIEEGILEKFLAESFEVEFRKSLQQALKASMLPEPQEELENEYDPNAVYPRRSIKDPCDTAVPQETLEAIAKKIFEIPEGFHLHSKLKNLMDARRAAIMEETQKGIDWGTAETLAYGSLLWEGVHVRISGQDCQRGTFSHRHAVLVDQENGRSYTPLQNLKTDQGRFDACNSPLSEYAVLAFELGYSAAWKNALVVWEAQFGDFCNGAQIVIDEYLSAMEQKWSWGGGIALYLPHGYEGQGPDHSSGRLERFLSLCARGNMIVVYPTTPAQFFHMLRRHILTQCARPLIVMTPKVLLRHPACVSSVHDLAKGFFHETLEEEEPDNDRIKTLIFCTGKIYYDLAEAKKRVKANDITIVRIEQLHPLNTLSLKSIADKYTNLKRCCWAQEEPKNMGAWTYIQSHLEGTIIKDIPLEYIGREASGAPASGTQKKHKEEQAAIMDYLFKEYEMRVPQDETGIKS